MQTLQLSLRIYVIGGGEIGTLLGVSAAIFNVQGGKIQPLVNKAYIENDMLVADELKDAIIRRNLFVIRDSDALSVELYRAYELHKKLIVLPSVYSLDGNGGMKGAHLSIRKATIKQFKIGKRDGLINQDAILFGFASGDAEIFYGSNATELFQREIMKIAGAIATSVEGVGRQLGL
jgi:hypothetical protein